MSKGGRNYPSPGEIIRIGEDRWDVRACLLGACGQESAIEVRRIGFSPPNDADGFPCFTHAPERFVRALLESGAAVVEAAPDPKETP